MEIWNLVFIQYNRDETGKLTPLPAKHVDTGMGFERICAVLQKKNSNYDTDVFTPIISFIEELSNKEYGRSQPVEANILWSDIDIAFRVIADHTRMLTFSIADGAIPSNKERGYVLTQILKRAARFGRILGIHEPFIYKIVDSAVESMGSAYPELLEKHSFIKKIIKENEDKFSETEKNGYDFFYRNIIGEPIRQSYIEKGAIDKAWYVNSSLSNGNNLVITLPQIQKKITINIKDELSLLNISMISGEDTFNLHATYGMHIDTTEALAKEIGIAVDRTKYEMLMEEHGKRSQDQGKSKWMMGPTIAYWIESGDEQLQKFAESFKKKDFQYDDYTIKARIEYDDLIYRIEDTSGSSRFVRGLV
jgi:alanyl-tRNA synthetase